METLTNSRKSRRPLFGLVTDLWRQSASLLGEQIARNSCEKCMNPTPVRGCGRLAGVLQVIPAQARRLVHPTCVLAQEEANHFS